MRYKFVHVFLTNSSNEKFKLTYQIRPNEYGEIWATCLEKSISSGLKETGHFYGFKPAPKEEIEKLYSWADSLVDELNGAHPHLNMPKLARSDLKNSVDHLLTDFADSRLMASRITEQNLNLWNEFQSVLRMISAYVQHQSALSVLQFPLSRIVFTWNNSHRIEIQPHQYNEYQLDTTFGTAYFDYAQVGRQLFEIFTAKDIDVPHTHIQPARFFSANTVLWFGPEMGHGARYTLMKEMQTWFETNFDLKKITGLGWGEKMLSIGQVPVGKLIQLPYSDIERKNLILQISKFNIVSHVELE